MLKPVFTTTDNNNSGQSNPHIFPAQGRQHNESGFLQIFAYISQLKMLLEIFKFNLNLKLITNMLRKTARLTDLGGHSLSEETRVCLVHVQSRGHSVHLYIPKIGGHSVQNWNKNGVIRYKTFKKGVIG